MHYKLTSALAEICFKDNKIISVCFDEDGNYYFNGHWHVMHGGLYYALFQYFSDKIISSETLNSAKRV